MHFISHPIVIVVVSLFCSFQVSAIETESNDASPSSNTTTPTKMDTTDAILTGAATARVIYRGAQVFENSTGEFHPEMAIVVNGDRIESVLPMSQLTKSQTTGAEVVDASHWYAIPGLVDSHVHVATLPARKRAEALLRRYLYSGITDVRDMAGDTRALADLSRSSLLNEIPAPDIFYSALMAGPSFFDDPRTEKASLGVASGQVPWMQAITEDTNLPLAVAQAKGTWASGLKIYANLPGELVRGIIEEAGHQQFPVWTHLQVFPATPYDSLGATSISHACMIAMYVADKNKSSYGGPAKDQAAINMLGPDHPEISEYITALVKSGTIMDATLRLYISRWTQKSEGKNKKEEPLTGPWVCPSELAAGITQAMFQAGVPIVAGTDGHTKADDPFPALHEEIEYLVGLAGMSNVDAIRAATSQAAILLGKEQDLGSLETGKYASIVFLEENPLDDISNLRRVVLTVKRGNRFPRSDYHHEPIPELPVPVRAPTKTKKPSTNN
jgi:hypothetical protein